MSATIENELLEKKTLLENLLQKIQELNKYELELFIAWKEYRFSKEPFQVDNLSIQQIKDCIKVANKLLGKTERDFL
jgi:hypothetical protein